MFFTLFLAQNSLGGVHAFIPKLVRDGVPLLMLGIPNAVQGVYTNLQRALEPTPLTRYVIDVWEPYGGCHPYDRRRMTLLICTNSMLTYKVQPSLPDVVGDCNA